ncbi:MAG: hypothetical protein K2W99_03565 [Chthoniobacterales bacterium]|nr:hypothetical protein [Chthoniobacterales bacterium]
MNLLFRLLILLLAILVLVAPLQAQTPPPQHSFNGTLLSPSSSFTGSYIYCNKTVFYCHFNQISKESCLYEDISSRLLNQCGCIGSLHLPEEIATFFQSVRINVVPVSSLSKDQFAKVGHGITPENFTGDYDDITPKAITLSAEYLSLLQSRWISYKNEDPSVLYILCMALLDQYLPQGVQNPDIKKYFEEAKTLPYYQEKNPDWISSTISENNAIAWFFANSAISYLHGSYPYGEPSSCYILKKNQPEFFSYLENLFGPQSGFLNQSFSYHGYFFNTASVDYSDWFQAHKEEIFQECRQQVAYIEQAGLPKNITDFFKSVPLRLKWNDQMLSGAEACYSDLYSVISLKTFDLYLKQKLRKIDPTGKEPLLLHELLHAFHHQLVPNGVDNPVIIKFYQEANVSNNRYYKCPDRSDSHFTDEWRENAPEFFACTATTFLAHSEEKEPTKVDDIFIDQPGYYNYLQSLFFGARGTPVGVVSDFAY